MVEVQSLGFVERVDSVVLLVVVEVKLESVCMFWKNVS